MQPFESHQILVGDCLDLLRQMPDQSVHCCVTSPPYYGLRDYGVDGQIGLEPDFQVFIANLVEVLREVRRVLRDDGVCWVNMGDSYAPDKQLRGQPWRLAFALQDDGWYLRQDIIWHKPNPMPESVRDRCTKAHEYLFLLSKSPRYYFDHEAIKEPAIHGITPTGVGFGYGSDADDRDRGRIKAPTGWDTSTGEGGHGSFHREGRRSRRDSFQRDASKREQVIPGQTKGTHRPDRKESNWDTATRNKRSVWTVATRGFSGAHFATFPPDLIRPCILAGCPPDGVVLDPFGGAGTTALVAMQEGRRSISCELNPDYADLATTRLKTAWLGWKAGRAIGYCIAMLVFAFSYTRWTYSVGRVHGFRVSKFPIWTLIPYTIIRRWWYFVMHGASGVSARSSGGVWNGIGNWTVFPARQEEDPSHDNQ